LYDEVGDRLLLYYRLRSPDERGYHAVIAESTDGACFSPVWKIDKEDLAAHSIERAHLTVYDGGFHLYISYDPLETPAFENWQIDLIEAETIAGLNPQQRIPVVLPFSNEVGSVKDPYLVRQRDGFLLYVSYHDREGRYSYTGLATSEDGRKFSWKGKVMPLAGGEAPGIARLSSVQSIKGGYLVFFDTAADMRFSGEEKSGVIRVSKLENISERDAEIISSPDGTGSLRYVATARFHDRILLFYEMSRRSRAHDLRCVSVSADDFEGAARSRSNGERWGASS
jgi:hypothetical protein